MKVDYKVKDVNIEYDDYFNKESIAQETRDKLSTGSIFKSIHINNLLNTMVAVPPEDALKKYTTHLHKILALKALLSEENAELIKQRNWLLPILINGQAIMT